MKRYFLLLAERRSFFMNNEENKKAWLEKCENILRLGGRSDLTIRSYRYSIIRFLNYFDNNTDIAKMNIENIISYFKENFLDKNLAASTYNTNVAAVRYFYIICFERYISKILLPTSKIRKRYPAIITKEKFLEILNGEKNIEHKCWLLLSFCSGLRISDIAGLLIENIDSKNHRLKILGKGNKERFTILPDIVIKYLRLYYKHKGYTNKTGYLFKWNDTNEHISPRTIGNYFTSLKKIYDLPADITEHSLRHSFATYYLKNGGDILILKSMLGHKSLETTSIYIHLARDFNNIVGINYGK